MRRVSGGIEHKSNSVDRLGPVSLEMSYYPRDLCILSRVMRSLLITTRVDTSPESRSIARDVAQHGLLTQQISWRIRSSRRFTTPLPRGSLPPPDQTTSQLPSRTTHQARLGQLASGPRRQAVSQVSRVVKAVWRHHRPQDGTQELRGHLQSAPRP